MWKQENLFISVRTCRCHVIYIIISDTRHHYRLGRLEKRTKQQLLLLDRRSLLEGLYALFDMTTNVKGVLHTDTHRFKWTIKSYFDGCVKIGDFYTSPVFSILHSGKITKWYLKTYPKGVNEESKDCIWVYLLHKSGGESEITVLYQASIATATGQNIPSRQIPIAGQISGRPWGQSVGKQDDIIDPKNGALIDGALTLSCEIQFVESVQDTRHKLTYSKLVDKIEKGFGDYEQLLQTNQYSDVIFIVQGKRIYLHKDILMCRNSFFKAMLEPKTLSIKRQLAKDAHEIKGVDYDVMLEVFRFIYAGKVNNIEKIVKKLLIAANRFAVVDLKALCELTLAKCLSANDLTIDNVVEYLKLIDKCNLADLQTTVINFAVSHYSQVIEKPDFKDLSSSVMFRIMQKIKPAI